VISPRLIKLKLAFPGVLSIGVFPFWCRKLGTKRRAALRKRAPENKPSDKKMIAKEPFDPKNRIPAMDPRRIPKLKNNLKKYFLGA
jgi:hypothetical protein